MPPNSRLNCLIDINGWKKTNPPLDCCYTDTIYSVNVLKGTYELYWLDRKQVNNRLIKDDMFKNLSDYYWTSAIWFKGCSINHSLYCWMEIFERLKTSDKLLNKGIGSFLTYCLCNSAPESHQHLFFNYQFSWMILKEVLLTGRFFLLEPNLLQVLQLSPTLGHKAI